MSTAAVSAAQSTQARPPIQNERPPPPKAEAKPEARDTRPPANESRGNRLDTTA